MQKTITLKNIPFTLSKKFNGALKEYRYKKDDKITEVEFIFLLIEKALKDESKVGN